MNIPSIDQILQDAARTVRRFPAVLLSAFIGTAAALVLADHEGPESPTILYAVLLAAILGISFLTAATLTAEKKKWGRPAYLTTLTAAVILLGAYAFTIPADLHAAPEFHLVRLVILAAALHMMVAVAPYLGGGSLVGYWQYNKGLCLRFVTAYLFSMVLFAGLSIALAALDNLFGMDVPGKRYFELWICISGVFTTWFFLAGIPGDLDELDLSEEYPKVIKIFSQYILFPLILVYLVILYAYIGKILIDWAWPRGWVSGLILGYGTTGMLLLLLLHPIRERLENAWMKSASRWFYLSMLPLVVMLFLAMYRRISEYGITEGRYIGVVLAVWFAAMAVYFLVSTAKNIKVIPASLCVVALMVSFGPWGAFGVSESSQVGRLKVLLENNSILIDDKIQKAPNPVSPDDRGQISSIIGYLQRVHGYDRIQPWFGENLRADSTRTGSKTKPANLVVMMMGIDYLPRWLGGGDGTITLNIDRTGIHDIGGYDHIIPSQNIDGMNLGAQYPSDHVAIRVNPELDTLTFIAAVPGEPGDSLGIALRPLVDTLLETYASSREINIPPERMSVRGSDRNLRVKLVLHMLQVRRRDGGVKINTFDVEILYSVIDERKQASGSGPQ